MKLATIFIGLLPGVLLATPASGQDPVSEETIQYFQMNCASCHTIGGGRLTGPDLKGVTDQQSREWLVDFVLDPKAVIDSGDPYALEILAEARGVPMPAVPGMTRERAGKLIDLIAIESALEKSRFAGVQLSDRPLTDKDVARGHDLFVGREKLLEGGPACLSCHTVGGVGGLGGGLLGPDLTGAFARLEGRRGLGAWLASPPSKVMQPLYGESPLDAEEILALVAYLRDSASTESAAPKGGNMTFVLAGIGLAAAFMVVFDVIWRRRFRAVRRPLIARS